MDFNIKEWSKKKKLTAGIALMQKRILSKNNDLLDLNFKRLCETESEQEGVIHTATLVVSMIGNHNNRKKIDEIIKMISKTDWNKIIDKTNKDG